MGFRDTLKKWDEEDKAKDKPDGADFMPDPVEIFGAKQEAPAQTTSEPNPLVMDPQTKKMVPQRRTYATFTDMPGQKFTAEQLGDIKKDTSSDRTIAQVGGALQGLTATYGAELSAAAGAALGKGEYSKLRDEQRGANTYAKSLSPSDYVGGELVGGALSPLNKVVPFASGKPLLSLSNTVRAAASGGLVGLGASDADLTKGEYGKAAVDIGIGAGFGVAGNTVLGGLGSGVRYVKSAPERAAKKADDALIDALAIKATPTNKREMVGDLGSDIPKVLSHVRSTPELEKALLNKDYKKAAEILRGQLATSDKAGAETVKGLEARWGQQDAQPLVDELEKIRAKYAANPAPESQKVAAKFQERIDTIKERWIPEPPKQLTTDEKLAVLWEKSTPEQRQEISANLPKFRAMAENTGMLDKFDNPAARASIADDAATKASIGLRSAVSSPGAQADAKRMVAALEKLRSKYAENPALESQRMAAEYQKRIDAIKERWVPEPPKPEPKGQELLATLSEGANAGEKQRIGDNSDLFEKVIAKNKLGPSANDPESRYSSLNSAVEGLGQRKEKLYDRFAKEDVLITDVTLPLVKWRDELSQSSEGLKAVPAVDDMIKRIWTAHGKGGERLTMGTKELRQEITKIQGSGFSGPYFDPSVAKDLQRQASGIMKGALDKHIESVGGARVAKQIDELNKEYSVLLTLRDAAERQRASARLVPPPEPETRTGFAPLPDVLDLARSTSDKEARGAILSSAFGGTAGNVGSSIDDIERLEMLRTISRRQQADSATAATVVVPPDLRTGKASVGEMFDLANATENQEAKTALMSSLAERMDQPSAEQLAKINADKELISQIEAPVSQMAQSAVAPMSYSRPGPVTRTLGGIGLAGAGAASMAALTGNFKEAMIIAGASLAMKYGPRVSANSTNAMAQMVTAVRAGANRVHLEKIGQLNKLPPGVTRDLVESFTPRPSAAITRTLAGDAVERKDANR